MTKSSYVQHAGYFAVLVFATISLPGCGSKTAPGAAQASQPVVRVVQPVEREVTDYAYFTGRTEAPDSVQIRARVSGYLVPWDFAAGNAQPAGGGNLKDYNFVSGQEVNRNQVLFKIDPRPYEAVYNQALGQIALAKARLQLAKADYARALNLARTPGAITRQDIDKYLAAQSEAEAEVQVADANSQSAKLNLTFTDILSPIDGVIGRNLLSVGNLVSADSSLLATVVSEDPMYAYFDVDESTLLKVQQMLREGKMKGVRAGNKIPVDLRLTNDLNDFPYRANLDFVNNQIDPNTGTLQVRGVIDNPKPKEGPRRFAPGMFVKVRVPIGPPHTALLVPQAAIGSDQGIHYVMVVNSENVVEYRPIATGEQQEGGMQEVMPVKMVHDKGEFRVANPDEKGEESLTAKDRIIIGGLQRVRPGLKVEVRQSESAAAEVI